VFGDEDELPLVGPHQELGAADDLDGHRLPAEHAAVEGLEILTQSVGERPPRNRQLHVVEPDLWHRSLPDRGRSLPPGGGAHQSVALDSRL
jgi:hypothetical protein